MGSGYSRYYTPLNGPESGSPPGSVLHSLQNIVGTISSMTQFIDSTMYAGWSSITALTTVAENFRRFRDDYLRKWLRLVMKILDYVKSPSMQHFNRENGIGPNSRWRLTLLGILPILLGVIMKLKSLWNNTVIVATDYIAEQPGHLSITKGESIIIIAEEDGWCFGQNQDGKEGCFPKNCVKNKMLL